MKDCDNQHIIYSYRSSLTWAICQKSNLCSVKSRKIHPGGLNYKRFLEVPWSADDGFLLSYFLNGKVTPGALVAIQSHGLFSSFPPPPFFQSFDTNKLT